MNFQLVERPAIYPGVSLLQLLSPRGFVDTGVDMPVGGRVYLEENVVQEAGVLFGMITRKEAETLRDEIASLKATVESLGRHLKERDPLFQALKKAMADDETPVARAEMIDVRDLVIGSGETVRVRVP